MEGFLTPDTSLVIPDGFARSRQELTRGVPFRWPLESDLSLILFVPTGFATIWRDTDPATVIDAGDEETLPHAPPRGADPQAHPPIRILLRQGETTLATMPLAAGLFRIAPDGDNTASILELFFSRWRLHAGCVRGPGDFGSFVEVAFRRVGPTTGNPRGGYLP
jgi:hypothetical protein